MEGVEILDTKIVYLADFSFSAFIIPVIVCAIIGGIWLLIDSHLDFLDTVMGVIVGAIVGVFIGVIVCFATVKYTDEISYIEHKVIISDEVNYNEFVAKYKVIKQEGKIYTVREKNEVDD